MPLLSISSFTTQLAADIINNDLKNLTSEEGKDVFFIDNRLFNRSSCKKTELGSRVFDHVYMTYKKGYRMLWSRVWSFAAGALEQTLINNESIEIIING